MAPMTKGIDLVHVPQLIFQAINADQHRTPGWSWWPIALQGISGPHVELAFAVCGTANP